MSGILEKNLLSLKNRYPVIYKELNTSLKINDYEVIDCADGNKTIKVTSNDRNLLLHSRYNPLREAENFAREKMKSQTKENLLFGFGMGYHLIEMQKLLEGDNRLFVYDIDINILKEAVTYNDLTPVLDDGRINIEVTGDLYSLLKNMEKVLGMDSELNVILHVPSVQAVPDYLEDFKFVLEDWNLRKSIDEKYGNLLYENYLSNRQHLKRNVCEFFGKFEGIPVIIVSAGPSLDKNMDHLKKVKNRALLICVGSALKILLKKGIVPDFFAVIDPQEKVYEQIRGFEEEKIPAVFLATASRTAVEKYNGPKFIAVQDAAYATEDEKNHLVNTGGSVATTSLDIALRMGGNPIIFVGQDLAFSGNKFHVEGYVHDIGKKEFNPQKSMRTVKGSNGEVLYTTLGLLSFKRWIENRISDEKNITFINATEGGAVIKGAAHLSLEAAIERYLPQKYDIGNIINNIINQR